MSSLPFSASIPLALLLLILLGSVPLIAVRAESIDRDQPIHFQTDHLAYDDVKQISVLTGHVVITKGTILIKAARVVLRQDPDGYQYVTAYANTNANANELAYFRQKRSNVNEYIEGYSKKIDYDGKREVSVLTHRAVVRRLQGFATVLDEVRGSVIRYDRRKNFYTADAGADIASPGNPSGRVRAMLSPRRNVTAPLDGAPTALIPSPLISETHYDALLSDE